MAKNETPNWKSKIAGEGRDENPRPRNQVFRVKTDHGGDIELTVAVVDGYRVAYLSKDSLGHVWPLSTSPTGRGGKILGAYRFYALESDGTPDASLYAENVYDGGDSGKWAINGSEDFNDSSEGHYATRKMVLRTLLKIKASGREENPRTPNHHRTGLIGDDYPIDPYRADAATTYDPYDRYWRTPNGGDRPTRAKQVSLVLQRAGLPISLEKQNGTSGPWVFLDAEMVQVGDEMDSFDFRRIDDLTFDKWIALAKRKVRQEREMRMGGYSKLELLPDPDNIDATRKVDFDELRAAHIQRLDALLGGRTPNGRAFEDAVEQARANIKELKYAVSGFWRQQNTLPKEKILAAYEIAKEAYKSVLYVRSCFFDDAEAQAKQKLDNAKTKFERISLANDSLDGDLRYTMSSFEETLGNPKVKVGDARDMINGLVHMPAWLNRVLNFYSEPDDFDSRTENASRQNYAEFMLESGEVIQVRAGDMLTIDPYMTINRNLKRSKRKVARATKTRIHLLDGVSYVVKTLKEYTGDTTYDVPETIIVAVNGKTVVGANDDLFE